MRVIFAGGGTGGHLYPAIAIAEELKSKNVTVKFYVSNRSIDARILKQLGYDFVPQNVVAFKGKGIISKVVSLFKLLIATIKMMPHIKKDDKVILMGGFASAPSAFIAKLKGAELYLHEQNSVMGLVNRVFAGLCKKVFLSFEDTKNAKGNTVVTGNPVRKVFLAKPKSHDYNGKLLILGGSQGSRSVNKLIASSISQLINEGFSVTHQTGEGLYQETIAMYGTYVKQYGDKLVIKPYINNVADVMNEADIAIARAGSGTIFELEALQCPAVYIPLKLASDNHQHFNALSATNSGKANMMTEDEATPKLLLEKLKDIKDNYEKFKIALSNSEKHSSAKVIVKEIGVE